MPFRGTLYALHLLVVNRTILNNISCSDRHKSINPRLSLTLFIDGDQTHHNTASTAIIQNFILPLRPNSKERNIQNWIGSAKSDEMFILPFEHEFVAYTKIRVGLRHLPSDQPEPVISVVSRSLVSTHGLSGKTGPCISLKLLLEVTEHPPLPSRVPTAKLHSTHC